MAEFKERIKNLLVDDDVSYRYKKDLLAILDSFSTFKYPNPSQYPYLEAYLRELEWVVNPVYHCIFDGKKLNNKAGLYVCPKCEAWFSISQDHLKRHELKVIYHPKQEES